MTTLACSEPEDWSGRTESGLHFQVEGEGPALVFIHGFSLDRTMWDYEARGLQGMYRVIRYDVRGHGLSDPWIEPFTAVQDLLDVLEAADVDEATLVGLSSGAEVAVDFALAHPDRVQGLVLASPSVSGYQPVGSFDWMSPVMSHLQVGNAEQAMDAWAETPLMAIPGDPRADSIMRAAVLPNWRIWTYDQTLQQPVAEPAIGRLASIEAPTLVVVGNQDSVDTKRVADTLAACVPSARLVVLEDAGHLVNLASPRAFSEAVQDFLWNGLSQDATGRDRPTCPSLP